MLSAQAAKLLKTIVELRYYWLTSSSPRDESVRLADKGLLDPPRSEHVVLDNHASIA
jgi:hypothetical protein